MNNPQIELVKKYLADPESVSAEELKRAADAAAADADTFVAAAYFAADAAADAAYFAASAAADVAAGIYADAADAAAPTSIAAANAKYWVEEYEELTK